MNVHLISGEPKVVAGKFLRMDPQTGPATTANNGSIFVSTTFGADGLTLIQGYSTNQLSIGVPGLVAHSLSKGVLPARDYFSILVNQPGKKKDISIVVTDGDFKYVAVLAVDQDENAIDKSKFLGLVTKANLDELLSSPIWAGMLHSTLSFNKPSENKSFGFLERGWLIPGGGVLVVGWAVTSPDSEGWLITSSGVAAALPVDGRVDRIDVVKAVPDFAKQYARNAGFICFINDVSGSVTEVHMIVVHSDGAQLVHSVSCENLPYRGPQFLDFLCGMVPDRSRLLRVFNDTFKSNLDNILFGSNGGKDFVENVINREFNEIYGEHSSIIIPIFGSTKFIKEQILALSLESEIMNGQVGVHFVIDDPRIDADVIELIQCMSFIYNIPLNIHSLPENLGFSRACNIGAHFANGQKIIFLNRMN
jgi:hypothetical protein